MAISRDPKYDIRLVDTVDGNVVLDDLPLMLMERGKALDFSAQLTSPLVTQIAGDSPQDKDLSRWNVRTQRDWSGGRGKDISYDEPDRYLEGSADTRFPGNIFLPPKPTQVGINTINNDPAYVGTLNDTPRNVLGEWREEFPKQMQAVYAKWDPTGRITVNTPRAKAAWSTIGRTNVAHTATASWSAAGRANGKRSARASWSTAGRSNGGQTANTNASGVSVPFYTGPEFASYASGVNYGIVAQSYTPPVNITVTSIELYLRCVTNPGDGSYFVSLQSDSGNAPSGTTLVSYSMTGANLATLTGGLTWFSAPISYTITAGVRYWIVLSHGISSSPTRDLRWGASGNNTLITGNGMQKVLAAGSWTTSGFNPDQDMCFKINNGAPYTASRQRLSQKFTTTGAVTVAQVQMYLQASAWGGAGSGVWRIETDASNSPSGTAVVSGSFAGSPATGWNTYAGAGSLSATTSYWLVLECAMPGVADNTAVVWSGDLNQAYGPGKVSTWNGSSWNAWTATAISFYFVINTGFAVGAPSFTEYAPSFQAVQQHFTPAAAVTVTQVQLYLERLAWTGSPTLTLDVLNGATVVATASLPDPTTTAGWKVYALSASLASGTQYTLRLSASVTNPAHSIDIAWWCDTNQGFAGGAYESRTMTDTGWGAWGGAGADGYFAINSGYASGAPYFYEQALTRVAKRQTFVSGAGGAVSAVKLYLQGISWVGTPTVQVIIQNTSGTVMGTATISNPGAAGWKTYSLAATLAASTAYWLTLMIDAPTFGDSASITWTGDSVQGYAGGQGETLTYSDGSGFGAPTASGADMYFACLVSSTPIAYYYDTRISQDRVAMRFLNTSAITATSLGGFLELISTTGAPTVQLILSSDSGGAVGSALATVAVTPSGTQWISGAISVALSAGAYYWVSLEVLATDGVSGAEVAWHGDAAQGYADGYARSAAAVDGAWGAWGAVGVDLYFRVNGGYPAGPYFYPVTLLRRRLVQPFTMVASTSLTRIDVLIGSITWQTGVTLSLKLYAWVSGNISGAPLATIGLSDPGIAAWETVTLPGVAVTNGNSYAWMLEMDTPGLNVNGEIGVYGSTTPAAGAAAGQYDFTGGAWGALTTTSSGGTYALFFGLNNFSTSITSEFRFTHKWAGYAYARPFSVGATTAVTHVRVYLKISAWAGAAAIDVKIYPDMGAGGIFSPIASGQITRAMAEGANAFTQYAWITVPISTSLAAGGYTLAVLPNCPVDTGARIDTLWAASSGGSPYLSITLSTAPVIGFLWLAGLSSGQPWFSINNGAPIISDVTVAPVRHGSNWYAAMGTGVYRFNTGTNLFDLVYPASANVTALASYGGVLFAALGDSNDMVSSTTGNTGTWAAATGRRGTYLLAYGYYLYLLKAVNASPLLSLYNGTVWDTIDFQVPSASFTGMAGFRDQVVILTTRGAFELSSKFIIPLMDYSAEDYQDNGRNATLWLRDNTLVIPIRQRLTQFDGSKTQPIGLDLDYGLPSGYQGRVAMMVGTAYWLFAAVDAGATGRSAIYAYNGRGWHKVVEATSTGARIQAIGFETITDISANKSGRLWYWEGSTPGYVEVPTFTDNPYAYVGAKFAAQGDISSVRFGGELSQVKKDFQSIVVQSRGMTTTQYAEVFLQLDNSATWLYAGRVTQSPSQEIILAPPNAATKIVANSSTASVINISALNTMFDMFVGAFVRIGEEIAQIAAINSGYQFTVVTPLSAAPAPGTVIYPARPSGIEARYRLVLVTDDQAKSPAVQRATIRWMPQLLEKWRFSFSVKLEDTGPNRVGGTQTLSAAYLRTKINQWARRVNPFTLVAPDGANYKVKITSVSEREYTRQEVTQNGLSRIASVISIVADEV